MRKVLSVILLVLPTGVFADHIDVMELQLSEGCSLSTFVALKDDINEQWGEKNGYQAEVLSPIQSDNLTSVYWLGRSANAAAFGTAYDEWATELTDPDSGVSKLLARFQECADILDRSSYEAL
jgi:hypothetical protein